MAQRDFFRPKRGFCLWNQSPRSELSWLRKTKDPPSAMCSWPRFGGAFLSENRGRTFSKMRQSSPLETLSAGPAAPKAVAMTVFRGKLAMDRRSIRQSGLVQALANARPLGTPAVGRSELLLDAGD